jgi:Xaa-Pro dipeptidase
MVFHMYASAAGVSFSETVLVSANGPQRLTQLPRKLMGTD